MPTYVQSRKPCAHAWQGGFLQQSETDGGQNDVQKEERLSPPSGLPRTADVLAREPHPLALLETGVLHDVRDRKRRHTPLDERLVRLHLLQTRVAEYQAFIKGRVPSFPITDVMQDSCFKKRKRVRFAGEDGGGAPGGPEGGDSLLPFWTSFWPSSDSATTKADK
ncbi:hypothetical protein CYMTET_8802 [Cymbomonas tetramitiformis]|uniref:Uncharacterized protein n=1 Tax=Cymbomonas tetramitiformis TaxID=36881 RepID=A0AAE0LFM8_9CHLO|nr:hypothetical protein CYMTET_8802 [Cymbomonas tetramitiformis]